MNLERSPIATIMNVDKSCRARMFCRLMRIIDVHRFSAVDGGKERCRRAEWTRCVTVGLRIRITGMSSFFGIDFVSATTTAASFEVPHPIVDDSASV